MAEGKLTGGLTNYYLAWVEHPQRAEQPPYQAECDDLVEVLQLTPDEAEIFKEVWRTAAARLGKGKPGHTPLYGAEKVYHRAGRILRRARRETSQ